MFMTRSIPTSILGANVWRRMVFPTLLAAFALGAAVMGATLSGDANGVNGLNGFVESLSGRSGSFLGDLGLRAPLGFAFAAGMASAVNPCGFAMLPAYLGLYLVSDDKSKDSQHPAQHLGKALLVGGAVTAGFVVLFGVAGVILGLGARSVVGDVLPWLGLVVGILLAISGAWMIGGGKLYTGIAARAAARMGNPGQVNARGYFLFGLSYGTASLSCTLPIFLTVVGTSFAVSSISASLGQFVLYGLGMGTVIMALTIGMASFKGAMVGGMRKTIPYIQPIGSWLMVLAGAYIVFYWLTIGGLL